MSRIGSLGIARAARVLSAVALCACAGLWAPAAASARLGFLPNVNGNPDTVSTFDTVSISEVGSPIALEPGTGANPFGVAIAPDGRHAYVTNSGAGNVSVIDVATRTANGSPVAVGTSPMAIAITPDGTRAYVVNGTVAGSVTPISLETNTAGTAIPLGADTNPRGIAITPDGTRAYVAIGGPSGDPGNDTVAIIDLTTNALIAPSITVGHFPSAIAITPDGSRAYVVNQGSQTVSVIDTATNTTVGAGISVSSAASIAMAPDGRRAYVVKATNPGAGVAVIDTASNSVIGSPIPMDAFPGGIAISPDGSRGFVAGGNSNRARAFDTATASVAGSPIPPVSQGAIGIAITPNQGPVAAFSASPSTVGTAVTFDASGSSDLDGTVSRYDWDFGDGGSLADGGPTPTHSYPTQGAYTATLTVTDNEGCSTQLVFTGQTAHCNGGSSARVQHDMTVAETPPSVADTTPPHVTLRGRKRQKLDGAVEVNAVCDEACSALASGTLVVKPPAHGGKQISSARKRFQLKGVTAQIASDQRVRLRLKVPFRARLRATKALAAGGEVTAKVAVGVTDTAGNRADDKRKVRFKAKH